MQFDDVMCFNITHTIKLHKTLFTAYLTSIVMEFLEIICHGPWSSNLFGYDAASMWGYFTILLVKLLDSFPDTRQADVIIATHNFCRTLLS